MSTIDRTETIDRLTRAGISWDDTMALLRASATLHTWAEHECNGVIQRDEATGRPYWHSAHDGRRLYRTPDRETGALERARAIAEKYGLIAYHQTDPRGLAVVPR